ASRPDDSRRIAAVARRSPARGVIGLVCFISPYKTDRDAVRALMPAGDFVEIYVKVSLETAARRDPKGLYKKAMAGEIKNFTGVDDPYEPPERPEIVIDTESASPDVAAQTVIDYLDRLAYLKSS